MFALEIGLLLVLKVNDILVNRRYKMKLKKFKKIIDKAFSVAEECNVNIEFYLGEEELKIEDIGQFGVVLDVVVSLKKLRKISTRKNDS
jgi:hypothetical protein